MKPEKVIAVRDDKTIYRDGDKRFKVFGDNYTKADVLNEALNQARIEETGLNIPRILEVTMLDGKWTIVSEHIKGITLAQLMAENEDKKDEYLELFVDLQTKIHSNTCPHLHKLKDKLNLKIRFSELAATTRFDLHNRLDNMPKHSKVCHGDFNPSNVIITDDGTPYIIDWSHVTQGNASADAARTYITFRLSGDTETAQKYLDLFCEKSGTDKQYVQKWIPIVAASLTTAAGEDEREVLLSLADSDDLE